MEEEGQGQFLASPLFVTLDQGGCILEKGEKKEEKT
jgi:hypothetical protein